MHIPSTSPILLFFLFFYIIESSIVLSPHALERRQNRDLTITFPATTSILDPEEEISVLYIQPIPPPNTIRFRLYQDNGVFCDQIGTYKVTPTDVAYFAWIPNRFKLGDGRYKEAGGRLYNYYYIEATAFEYNGGKMEEAGSTKSGVFMIRDLPPVETSTTATSSSSAASFSTDVEVPTTLSDESTRSTDASEETDDLEPQNNDGNKKLSKNETIAIAVSVSVGSIVIFLALFIFLRMRKQTRRKERNNAGDFPMEGPNELDGSPRYGAANILGREKKSHGGSGEPVEVPAGEDGIDGKLSELKSGESIPADTAPTSVNVGVAPEQADLDPSFPNIHYPAAIEILSDRSPESSDGAKTMGESTDNNPSQEKIPVDLSHVDGTVCQSSTSPTATVLMSGPSIVKNQSPSSEVEALLARQERIERERVHIQRLMEIEREAEEVRVALAAKRAGESGS